MGLELLARSTIAHFSPTLLAEPDRDHKNLLHALDLGSAKIQKKTITTNQVLTLCKILIPEFTDELLTVASAITARRNEEVHSGTAAFSEYPAQKWLGGFYKCCKILCEQQKETLDTLFGKEESDAANKILGEIEEKDLASTKALISAHKKVFESNEKDEKLRLISEAEKQGELLSHQRHHRIACPACGCAATVKGDLYGRVQIEHVDNEIITRQSVIPTEFNCKACGLKLSGYGKLKAGDVAEHFTHRVHYTPEEYYDLIDPYDESAPDRIHEIHGYRQERPGYREWDNE